MVKKLIDVLDDVDKTLMDQKDFLIKHKYKYEKQYLDIKIEALMHVWSALRSIDQGELSEEEAFKYMKKRLCEV